MAEWETEKAFLRPVHSIEPVQQKQKHYSVRKDNSISYRGNFYSLPYDTYKGRGTKVLLTVNNNVLIIADQQHNELCRHALCDGVGQKIINRDHRRNKDHGIIELQERFCLMVNPSDKARHFITAIRADKPRYMRDQLITLLDAAKSASPAIVSQALHYCCDNNIRGAADFKAIIAHLQGLETIPEEIALKLRRNPLNNQLPDQALIQPRTSSIHDYNLF